MADFNENIIKRLKAVIKKFKRLNNPEWMFRVDPRKVNQVVNKYKKELSKILLTFITRDQVEKIVDTAVSEFIDDMRKFITTGKFKLSRQRQRSIAVDIIKQYTNQTNAVINNITGKQLQKKLTGDIMVDSAQLIDKKILELNARLKAINLKTKTGKLVQVTKKSISNIAGNLKKRFGDSKTVTYSGGKEFPLVSYVEMRQRTTDADIHRITTSLQAAKHGILTGKISRHGATDSCRLFEGMLIFFTQEGKDLFIKENPGAPVKNWPTQIELQQGKRFGHIFKPNCRHIVSPFPVQFFSEKNRAKDIRKNNELRKSRPIPKKIDESQIEKDIMAGLIA